MKWQKPGLRAVLACLHGAKKDYIVCVMHITDFGTLIALY